MRFMQTSTLSASLLDHAGDRTGIHANHFSDDERGKKFSCVRFCSDNSKTKFSSERSAAEIMDQRTPMVEGAVDRSQVDEFPRPPCAVIVRFNLGGFRKGLTKLSISVSYLHSQLLLI